ncbi:hypothetical protein [Candidatus Harpocratesius sp.]
MQSRSIIKRSRIPKIIELWIFNNSGLLLLNTRNLNYSNTNKVDPLLFSGMLAAMEFISEKKLSHIAMNDLQLVLLPILEPIPLFLVALTYKYVKSRRVRAVLQEIYEEFIKEFNELIPHWNGNLSIFDYFQKRLTDKYFS